LFINLTSNDPHRAPMAISYGQAQMKRAPAHRLPERPRRHGGQQEERS
jgi:hypothetical protein